MPTRAALPAGYTIRTASWVADEVLIQHVRRRVFIEEQGVPEHEEWDAADRTCNHVLALDANRDAVGTGRLEPTGKIGRVAVLPQYRGTGVGAALMDHLIGLAATRGLEEVYLNAQVTALRFYERLGFQAEGPEFDEVGIPHRRMRRPVGKTNEQQAGRDGNTEHPVEP